MKKLRIKQVKSYIGRPEKQRQILRGMGLGKLNKTVLLNDTPEIRGMAQKVIHLVTMEEVRGKDI
ncbi:MAG TPA: 50S ribosomal protein L30 [Syntrophales bacterium]|nr:50S ribosomal protein L30 [Syntrophales bacterium]